jgi:hypothetical protein
MQYFSLRMFVPEHKHPLMSTRNRLHEFLVDDACAQGAPACGVVLKTPSFGDVLNKKQFITN